MVADRCNHPIPLVDLLQCKIKVFTQKQRKLEQIENQFFAGKSSRKLIKILEISQNNTQKSQKTIFFESFNKFTK